MTDVILYITVGVVAYALFDLGIALASIINAKPYTCMFFGAIALLCATALLQMVRGELFPEFLKYVSQSEFNFIPILWGLVILTFASAVSLMIRAVYLMTHCEVH